ncbi:MAG: diacylglycerol kinase family protein [Verrucomicrobia bacterium]|nr:diacylglycerol kinase family protein [Cytophagales bacterium]
MPEFSIRKRLFSFTFAFNGILHFLKTQHNAWIHAVITLLVVVFGFWLKVSLMEWLFLVFAIGFVFVAEMFNTALELLVDLVSPDFHTLAGKTKDVAAGAVLVAAITAALIGLAIFLPKLWVLLF